MIFNLRSQNFPPAAGCYKETLRFGRFPTFFSKMELIDQELIIWDPFQTKCVRNAEHEH